MTTKGRRDEGTTTTKGRRDEGTTMTKWRRDEGTTTTKERRDERTTTTTHVDELEHAREELVVPHRARAARVGRPVARRVLLGLAGFGVARRRDELVELEVHHRVLGFVERAVTLAFKVVACRTSSRRRGGFIDQLKGWALGGWGGQNNEP